MKVLCVMGGYIPAQNYGGQVTSVKNLIDLLDNTEVNFYILTLNHDLNSKIIFNDITNGWNHKKNCDVWYLNDSEVNFSYIVNIVNELKPDILYLQSFCNWKFLMISRKISLSLHIPMIIAPRGEYNENAMHKKFKKILYAKSLRPFLKRKDVFLQATSDIEKKQIEKYIIKAKDKIMVMEDPPELLDSNTYEKNYKIAGEINCVFISRICRIKNLIGAIEILSLCKSKVSFDVYGPIEDEEYWNECKKQIAKLNANITVNYKGNLKHEKVKETIAKYDLFFFPTLSENYGYVIVEALQAHTPILISDQTPWIEPQDFNAGYALPLEAYSDFAKKIDQYAGYDFNEYNKLIQGTAEYLEYKVDYEKLKLCYLNNFKQIIRKSNNELC